MKIRKKLKENYDEATKEFTEITGNQNGVQQTVEKFKQLINRDAFPENQQDINFWRMRGWKQFKAAVDAASKTVDSRDSKSPANTSSDNTALKHLIYSYPMDHTEIQKQLVASGDQPLSYAYIVRSNSFTDKKRPMPFKVIQSAIKHTNGQKSDFIKTLAKSIDFSKLSDSTLTMLAKSYPEFIGIATNFLTPEQQASIKNTDDTNSANTSSDNTALKHLIYSYPMDHTEIQKQLDATGDQALSYAYIVNSNLFTDKKRPISFSIMQNAIKHTNGQKSDFIKTLAKSIDFSKLSESTLLTFAKLYPEFMGIATNFLTPEQQASIKKTSNANNTKDTGSTTNADANDTTNASGTADANASGTADANASGTADANATTNASVTTTTNDSEFYIYDNKNKTQGPFSKYDLASRLRSNKLDASTYVQQAGTNKWVKADEVDELAKFVNKADSATANTETDTTEESESNYYVYNNDTQEGPYSASEVVSKIQSNEFDADVFVWKDGLPEWVEADQDDELSSKLNIDSSDADYYVSIKNKAEGPMTNDDVVSLLSSSKITEKSLVWSPDLDGWTPFSDVDDLTKKADEREYVAWVNDKSTNPMMIDEVAKNIKKKTFKSTTLIWREGLKKWTPIQSVRELKKLLRK